MPAEFTVTGGPVTGAGVLGVTWNAVPAASWFGNATGSLATPVFNTDPLPAALIPSLDASVITTGVLDPARLPVAVGLGVSHAPGAVPDPGDGSIGDGTDYLARDITYKPVPSIGPTYQPTLPTLTLSVSTNPTGPVSVKPQSTVSGVTFFYSFTSDSTDFVEFPDAGYVSVPDSTGNVIWIYGARVGYNNSPVETYTNTNLP
jgi:hypothetical protein